MGKAIEILREKLINSGLDSNEFVERHNNGEFDVILSAMKEYKGDEIEFLDFESASKPLMKYLAENHHPHVMANVECNKSVLWEGQKTVLTEEFIVD